MRISIAGKVCFVLLLIFSSVLIGITAHQAYRERQMALAMHGTQAQQLLQGIRSAITHLHGRGLLHGDLYAHNILCNLQTGQAVLSDFGAAALLQGLPETQKAQLQQIELRALRHLENEVQALVG